MKVFIQSVNFNADSDLLKFAEVKVQGLTKFHDKIIDAEVFLKVQNTSDKENKISEIKGFEVKRRGELGIVKMF